MKIGPSLVAIKRWLLGIQADLYQFGDQIFAILAATGTETFDLWQRNGNIVAGKA